MLGCYVNSSCKVLRFVTELAAATAARSGAGGGSVASQVCYRLLVRMHSDHFYYLYAAVDDAT